MFGRVLDPRPYPRFLSSGCTVESPGQLNKLKMPGPQPVMLQTGKMEDEIIGHEYKFFLIAVSFEKTVLSDGGFF